MSQITFLHKQNDRTNNYLEDLWSEIVVTFILRKRQTIEYKTQLTTKASIPEYIYHSVGKRVRGSNHPTAVGSGGRRPPERTRHKRVNQLRGPKTPEVTRHKFENNLTLRIHSLVITIQP